MYNYTVMLSHDQQSRSENVDYPCELVFSRHMLKYLNKTQSIEILLCRDKQPFNHGGVSSIVNYASGPRLTTWEIYNQLFLDIFVEFYRVFLDNKYNLNA